MKAIENLINKIVIVRSFGAGLFFGTLKEVELATETWTVELENCRRLWRWEGACSVTQLAVDGTKKPDSCLFSLPEKSIVISSVIEIHACSEKSIKSINGVKEWKV